MDKLDFSLLPNLTPEVLKEIPPDVAQQQEQEIIGMEDKEEHSMAHSFEAQLVEIHAIPERILNLLKPIQPCSQLKNWDGELLNKSSNIEEVEEKFDSDDEFFMSEQNETRLDEDHDVVHSCEAQLVETHAIPEATFNLLKPIQPCSQLKNWKGDLLNTSNHIEEPSDDENSMSPQKENSSHYCNIL